MGGERDGLRTEGEGLDDLVGQLRHLDGLGQAATVLHGDGVGECGCPVGLHGVGFGAHLDGVVLHGGFQPCFGWYSLAALDGTGNISVHRVHLDADGGRVAVLGTALLLCRQRQLCRVEFQLQAEGRLLHSQCLRGNGTVGGGQFYGDDTVAAIVEIEVRLDVDLARRGGGQVVCRLAGPGFVYRQPRLRIAAHLDVLGVVGILNGQLLCQFAVFEILAVPGHLDEFFGADRELVVGSLLEDGHVEREIDTSVFIVQVEVYRPRALFGRGIRLDADLIGAVLLLHRQPFAFVILVNGHSVLVDIDVFFAVQVVGDGERLFSSLGIEFQFLRRTFEFDRNGVGRIGRGQHLIFDDTKIGNGVDGYFLASANACQVLFPTLEVGFLQISILFII